MSMLKKKKKENTGIYFPAQKYLPPKKPPLDLTTNKYSAFLYFVFWQSLQSYFTLVYPNLLTFTQSKPYSVQLRWVQRELQTWKSNNSTNNNNKKKQFPNLFYLCDTCFPARNLSAGVRRPVCGGAPNPKQNASANLKWDGNPGDSE